MSDLKHASMPPVWWVKPIGFEKKSGILGIDKFSSLLRLRAYSKLARFNVSNVHTILDNMAFLRTAQKIIKGGRTDF
ncbi:MAG: hypothetical protein R6U55_12665 [Desulfovermiculus sp.]